MFTDIAYNYNSEVAYWEMVRLGFEAGSPSHLAELAVKKLGWPDGLLNDLGVDVYQQAARAWDYTAPRRHRLIESLTGDMIAAAADPAMQNAADIVQHLAQVKLIPAAWAQWTLHPIHPAARRIFNSSAEELRAMLRNSRVTEY